MRYLAARADATLETLSALAISEDGATRFGVARNMGSRMRMDEPGLAEQKQAIFEQKQAIFEQ